MMWYTYRLPETKNLKGKLVFHVSGYFLTTTIRLSLLQPKSFYPKY